MKLAVILILLPIFSYSQFYTASVYYGSAFGVELRKNKTRAVYGIGMTTFFNKGANGKDYTGFVNPSLAYEQVSAYNGTIYANAGYRKKLVTYGIRLGFGARKIFYNGITNGENWYVVRDGGTYLLYGGYVGILVKKFQISYCFDNINKMSFGVGFNFKEN